QPETGDDLQWEKAGLLEVADLVVIHKADLPGADRVEAQVLSMLSLSSAAPPKVLRVSARTGAGMAELWQAIAGLPLRRSSARERDLLRLAQEALAARFRTAKGRGDARLQELAERYQRGEVSASEAGMMLLRLLQE